MLNKSDSNAQQKMISKCLRLIGRLYECVRLSLKHSLLTLLEWLEWCRYTDTIFWRDKLPWYSLFISCINCIRVYAAVKFENAFIIALLLSSFKVINSIKALYKFDWQNFILIAFKRSSIYNQDSEIIIWWKVHKSYDIKGEMRHQWKKKWYTFARSKRELPKMWRCVCVSLFGIVYSEVKQS